MVFCWKSTSSTLRASTSDIRHPRRESNLMSSLSLREPATPSISSISANSRYAFICGHFQRILDSALSLKVSSLHGIPANIFAGQLAIYFGHLRPAEILAITQAQNYSKIHRESWPTHFYPFGDDDRFCLILGLSCNLSAFLYPSGQPGIASYHLSKPSQTWLVVDFPDHH